ncbi:MAG TPA: CsbD family protein [Terriglobales bacterium]|nr:CsbD family protein [Terriglobales bacterium]
MDKDRIKGKAKDVAGRIQRQAGEWTGDEENQAEGAEKQVEGKVQNAWGQVKDAGRKAADDAKADAEAPPQRTRAQGRECSLRFPHFASRAPFGAP